jgi:hypothetical protein
LRLPRPIRYRFPPRYYLPRSPRHPPLRSFSIEHPDLYVTGCDQKSCFGPVSSDFPAQFSIRTFEEFSGFPLGLSVWHRPPHRSS